ncbi:hypothetical protein G6L12_31305 [Agrobacterium rhizogenes]|nr:hypothetical protein [Rhizobium rhizogenes]NTF78989.1 hypothetical protein [Rhizobium rhizogenes]
MELDRRQLLIMTGILLTTASSAHALLPPETAQIVDATVDQPCTLAHAVASLMKDDAEFRRQIAGAKMQCEAAEKLLGSHAGDATKLGKPLALRRTINKMFDIKSTQPIETISDVVKLFIPIVTDNKNIFGKLVDAKSAITEAEYERLLLNLAKLTLLNSALLDFPAT